MTPLLTLSEDLPPVVDSVAMLRRSASRLAEGTGPLAVDAERASGYRYSQRAYLVQLRRAGAGTVLVDPVAVGDLASLAAVVSTVPWVVHAASQDLPCLAEVGLVPPALFDTEMAGRLLGYERVGLATLVETLLGFRLAKEHSAVDWSTRPLPEPWLRYAALDVEPLLGLAHLLDEQLRATGKRQWAEEEFAALAAATPAAQRTDPWRRTSGIHRVRSPRQLAVVRELWTARDRIARRRDLAPGRVLNDAAIIAAATEPPDTEMSAVPGFGGRGARRYLAAWATARERALRLPATALPEPAAPYDGPPPARSWPDRNSAAADRLAAVRAVLGTLAGELSLPVENLLAPDAVRRLVWQPPVPVDAAAVAARLTERGARSWQVELTADLLAATLAERTD